MNLREDVATLEARLVTEAERESEWRSSTTEIVAAKQATEREMRELSLQLVQLQAKSPEVWPATPARSPH